MFTRSWDCLIRHLLALQMSVTLISGRIPQLTDVVPLARPLKNASFGLHSHLLPTLRPWLLRSWMTVKCRHMAHQLNVHYEGNLVLSMLL